MPDLDAPTTVGRTLEHLVTWVRRTTAATALPASTVTLLDRLSIGGPARITDLAEAEGVSQPGMTTLVNRLSGRGWTTRTPDPTDGRAALVAITDAGGAALADHRARRAAALASRLADLDDADLAALLLALPALERLAGTPSPDTTTRDEATAGA